MPTVTWDHVHLRSPDPEAMAAWLEDILGGDRIDVLDRQSEVVEPLMGMTRGRADTVAGCDRCNENHRAPEFDVDAAGATNNLPAEDVFKPGGHCLRIGTAQMNVVPGHYRHTFPPIDDFCAARGGLKERRYVARMGQV